MKRSFGYPADQPTCFCNAKRDDQVVPSNAATCWDEMLREFGPEKHIFIVSLGKNRWSVVDLSFNQYLQSTFRSKARFKRRILHAPNRIAELSACKMRRLNQLNATYFNSMRVSRIFD